MEKEKQTESNAPQQQSIKKRKTLPDLNGKPKEERQQKYYWPKIDVEKKKTPKSKTPKPKTPKPVTPKPRKKYSKRVDHAIHPKTPDQVLKADSTCKQSLNFNDADLYGLKFDMGLDSLSCSTEHLKVADDTMNSKLVSLVDNIVGADPSIPTLETPSPRTPTKLLSSTETAEHVTCLRALNFNDESLGKRIVKCVKVYQRRLDNTCLRTCRKLGLSFRKSHRRKRNSRKKISLESLKQLGRFNEFLIDKDVLYQIAIVRCNGTTLFPMKEKVEGIALELFQCVLSLVSSSITFRKKRRSFMKTIAHGNNPILVSSDNGASGNVHNGAQNSTADSLATNLAIAYYPLSAPSQNGTSGDVNIGVQNSGAYSSLVPHLSRTYSPLLVPSQNGSLVDVHNGVQNSATYSLLDPDLSMTYNPLLVPSENGRGGDDVHDGVQNPTAYLSLTTNLTNHLTSEGGKTGSKQKKRRPYKSKTKRVDYFSGITDWRDESLEQFMDPLINQFKVMELYDNPKALERWSVQFSNEDDKGDGLGDIKWEEERRVLLQRIAKFIYVMTESQGSRDFVKWNGSVLDSVVGVFLTQNVSDVLSSNAYMELGSRYPIKTSSSTEDEEHTGDIKSNGNQGSSCGATTNVVIEHPEEEESTSQQEELRSKDFDDALNEMLAEFSDLSSKGKSTEGVNKIDWEAIRIKYVGVGQKQRSPENVDSVDWEAVRKAPVADIAKAIHGRGQHRIIAEKIQNTLNRILKDHGSLDLEWLRELPTLAAKAYLLSFYGLGLKSVECLRLLTLHHHAFPVDVNIARIVIRLGWVPIKPLPMGLHFHLLEKYPLENEIQKYLWPRLSHLDQRTLYKLHYHMITFGKVFCMKKRPNCAACPFKTECKYYASVVASKLPLPSGQQHTTSKSKGAIKRFIRNPFDVKPKSRHNYSLPAQNSNSFLEISPYLSSRSKKCEPIVEMPPSPERQEAPDIEDFFSNVNDEAHNDEEEISEIKLNSEEFRKTLRNYFEENNIPFGGNDYLSRALVSLSPEDASMPLPKHMFAARLRTEHQVYELPDYHPLLKDLDRRDEKDPLPYLLATWLPDKNVHDSVKDVGGSIEDSCCTSQDDSSLTIPGTILIPSRTAMRGSFALNGTYFQVNEVFADDESSQCPIDVPRVLIWNLRRRTLYCGSSTSSIFRGLTWGEIKRCCCEGFICTRAFNRRTRAPKPLPNKFHNRQKGKATQLGDDED